MTANVGICYRNYTNYTLYRSCLPIYGIAIIFLDDFGGNANISVAIKSGSTVIVSCLECLSFDSLLCYALALKKLLKVLN